MVLEFSFVFFDLLTRFAEVFVSLIQRIKLLIMGNCLSSSPSHSSSIRSQTESSSTPGVSGTSSSAGKSVDVSVPYPNGQILDQPNLKEFTFAELKLVTKNFRDETLLGQGGFGKVYKGCLEAKTLAPCKSDSGMLVAIKIIDSERIQGFETVVNLVGRLNHPNLVKLLGFCWEDRELLLVYEFMLNGSLENHLFGSRSSIEPLPWEKRLKIAIGAARGLAFLHSSENEVIYRNFKSSNILLDMDYNAKISDLGLARFGPSIEESSLSIISFGTCSYIAPEYEIAGHMYVKSDVYGFGVVLLEIMTGLRAHDINRCSEQRNLVNWAKPLLKKRKKVKTLMDARIKGQYSSKAAVLVRDLTLQCLETDSGERPSMQEVLQALEQIEELKNRPK